MRESDRVASSAMTQYVAGRLFVQSGGAWIEDGAQSASETLEILYLSGAYFQLLAAHPELGDVLSLGQDITIKAGEGKAILIRASSGREAVSASELERIFAD
jgi:hypothetical protein